MAVLAGLFLGSHATAMGQTHRVYFGTYTQGASQGIYAAEWDDRTGELTEPELVGECKNPSFLAIHPNGKSLYAVSEIGDFEGNRTGAVQAFRVESDGMLAALNAVPSSGQGPCHLVVDGAGKHVLVANYGSGSVSTIAIKEDGSLGDRTGFAQHEGTGPNAARQEGPHAHSIHLDAANRFAFAADLGIDQIRIYKYDYHTGAIAPSDPPSAAAPAGGGPRHFAWHPSGKFAFVNNEMLSSVNAYRYDRMGRLTLVNTVSTLPPDAQEPGNSTAEVQVHPNGKFLYCSNRGHDSLAIMTIDQDSGKLEYVGNTKTGGKTPRNFAISPSGKFILAANQSTDNVVVFSVDEGTGALKETGASVDAPMPVCIKFLKL
jgi:6-phosphogluconolactonase